MHLIRLCRRVELASLVFVVASGDVSAQIKSVVALSIGGIFGQGGFYQDRTANFTGEMFAGVRTARAERWALVGGAFGGGTRRLTGGTNLNCPIDRTQRCAPGYPNFRYGGLAGGVEFRRKPFGVTLLAGPGAFASGETLLREPALHPDSVVRQRRERYTTAFGVLGRIDVTGYFNEHLGIFGSLSTRALPNFRGDALYLNAVHVFGVRVQ